MAQRKSSKKAGSKKRSSKRSGGTRKKKASAAAPAAPPAEVPPAEAPAAPPAEAPQAEAPAAEAPAAPPAEMPQAEAPAAPPAEAPPAEAPFAEVPPAEVPPAEAPPREPRGEEASGSGDAADPPASGLQEFFFSGSEAAAGSGGLYSAGGATDQDAALEYLAFDLATESYAVPVAALREIVRPLPVTVVPRTPEYVRGVVTLRGAVLPVFDLRLRLRLPRPDATNASRILVVETVDGAAGILVDRVEGVVRGGEQGLEAPPTSLGGGAEYLEGLLRVDGQLHIVLDLNSVLAVQLAGRRADGRAS